MLQTFSFDQAGRQIDAAGFFLRYERETSGAVDDSVTVFIDGHNVGKWRPGDAVEYPRPFNTIRIEPSPGQAGEFRVGAARFMSSRMAMSGSVQSVVAVNRAPTSAPAHSTVSVGVADTLLLAANANRKSLLIQNTHPTADLWIRVDGVAAAAAAPAIRIGPGGNYEPDVIPTGQIRGYSTVAANAVTLLEG